MINFLCVFQFKNNIKASGKPFSMEGHKLSNGGLKCPLIAQWMICNYRLHIWLIGLHGPFETCFIGLTDN